MRITFLGTGGSLGVPLIGCKCPVCGSGDSRDHRLRPSIMIRLGGMIVLIDTSPDFRQQALENGIDRVDGLLFTHAHADHSLGMDDLRILVNRRRKQIPVYASAETLRRLRRMFGYFFETPIWSTGIPMLKTSAINGNFELCGIEFIPLEVMHNKLSILGFRFGGAAYITDASGVPDESAALLGGLDLLIVNALRYVPHEKHFSVRQAVDFIASVRPKQALLTHMSHELGFERLKKELPEGVSPAFDGLTVDI